MLSGQNNFYFYKQKKVKAEVAYLTKQERQLLHGNLLRLHLATFQFLWKGLESHQHTIQIVKQEKPVTN